MKQIDEFDDLFRDRLEDFESAPTMEEWQKIQARLHPKRRRIALWWWIPTGIAALIGSVLVCRQLPTSTEHPSLVEEKNIVTNNTQNTIQNTDNQTITPSKIIQKNDFNEVKNKNTSETLTVRIGTKTYEKTEVSNQPIVYHEVPEIQNSEPNVAVNIVEKDTKVEKRPFLVFELLPLLKNSIFSEKEIENPNFEKIFTKNPENIKIKKSNRPLKFYAGISPTYNFKNIDPNLEDDIFVSNIKNPSLSSINRIGLQLETRVSKQISKHFGFSTALVYQLTPFDLSYNQRKENTEVVVSSIGNAGNSLNINDVSYENLQIERKQNLHSLAGVFALNYILNEKNTLSLGVGKGAWLGKEKLSGSPTFATISYEKTFGKGLKITPYFNYHLRQYKTFDKTFNIQPYQLGLKLGF